MRGIAKERIGPMNALVLSIPDLADDYCGDTRGFECMMSTYGVFAIRKIRWGPKKRNLDLRFEIIKDGRRAIAPSYQYG